MYQWPYRDNSSEKNYRMDFKIKKMENLKRRNKIVDPCYENNDYDSFIIHGIEKEIGCKPFYRKAEQKLAFCTNQTKMRNISQRIEENYFGSVQEVILPCNEIQQIQFEFDEVDYSRIFDFGNDYDFTYGWFMVRLEFQSLTFKEVACIQKYGIESLIGNAGGYAGLFVGYNFLDLPRFIIFLRNILKWQ